MQFLQGSLYFIDIKLRHTIKKSILPKKMSFYHFLTKQMIK